MRLTRFAGLWILLALLASAPAGAFAGEGALRLSGHANLAWKQQKRSYRFDQAISVQDPARPGKSPVGIFETLDDFGNTVLRIEFFNEQVLLVQGQGGQKVVSASQFGRLLSLPVGREEFLSYLLNRLPDDPALEVRRDARGRVASVRKKSRNKSESYQVAFSDYRPVGDAPYPFSIVFSSKKTKLHLTWQSLHISR